MPEPAKESCLNCKFWSSRQEKWWSIGNCRAHPPRRVAPEPRDPESPAPLDRSVFPLTNFTDWCGEWVANPNPPEAPVQPMSEAELERQAAALEAEMLKAMPIVPGARAVPEEATATVEDKLTEKFKPKTLAQALAETQVKTKPTPQPVEEK